MSELYKDFIKAQKEFEKASKEALNPHFRSKYADLAACVDAVKDALNNNNFALMQETHECENGVKVSTLFLHVSGEKISGGTLFVPASKNDAHGFGSALTYARRYSLLAASGIAPEDDDGNASINNNAQPVKTPLEIKRSKIIELLRNKFENKPSDIKKWLDDNNLGSVAKADMTQLCNIEGMLND